MRGGVGIAAAHDDVHRTARITGARTPPLATVEQVVIAGALDAAGNVGSVRGGHLRFGHEKRRADLAAQQRLEPALLQRGARIALEHFHVAGVGRGAIEHLGCKRHAPHDFAQRCVIEIRQPLGRSRAARQEEIPQTDLPRPTLQGFDEPGRSPRVAGRTVGGDFFKESLLVGVDLRVHEIEQACLQGFDGVAVLEVHGLACDPVNGARVEGRTVLDGSARSRPHRSRVRAGFRRCVRRGAAKSAAVRRVRRET